MPYDPITPLRSQLAKFLGNNHQLISAFEALFAKNSIIAPSYSEGQLLTINADGDIGGIDDVAVGNVLLSAGIGVIPAYGKVGLTTHVSGILPLANGGTGANLSLTGGTSQVVRQNTLGGVFTVSQLQATEIANGQTLSKTDDTNVTLALTGGPSSALLSAVNVAVGWSGQLATSRGGTALSTYTTGDLLYASALNTLGKLSIGTSGKVLSSNGTIPGWSTSSFPLTAGGVGTFLRSNGADWVTSTLTLPNTLTANQVLYGSGTNAVGASANLRFDGSKLAVGGSGTIPSIVSVGSPTTAAQTVAGAEALLLSTTAATSGIGALFEDTGSSSVTSGPLMGLYENDGAAMASGDRLGGFVFGGSSSASALRTTAGVFAFAEETFIDGSAYGTLFRFETTSIGATGRTEKWRISANGSLSNTGSTGTAYIHLKAGTTSANTAPLKFTSGSLLTSAEAGAVEFLTDKYYGTITTGAARKEITLNDIALTSGRVPFVTTNGRLTDDSDMTFSTDTLTVTKIVGSTSVTASNLTAGRFTYSGASGLLTDTANALLDSSGNATFAGTMTVNGGTISSNSASNAAYQATVSGTANGLFGFNATGAAYFGAPNNTLYLGVLQNYGISFVQNNALIGSWSSGTFAVGSSVATFASVGTTASAANAYLDNGASNSLLRSTSSVRYKTGMELLERDEAINITLGISASAMSYLSRSPHDDGKKRFFGVTAEEMHKIEPRLVTYVRGLPEAVQYERIPIVHSVVIADHELRLRRAGL